eukprot:772476-Alexandrium_andersonii.AAC.1
MEGGTSPRAYESPAKRTRERSSKHARAPGALFGGVREGGSPPGEGARESAANSSTLLEHARSAGS